jgi:hypothetical protein
MQHMILGSDAVSDVFDVLYSLHNTMYPSMASRHLYRHEIMTSKHLPATCKTRRCTSTGRHESRPIPQFQCFY